MYKKFKFDCCRDSGKKSMSTERTFAEINQPDEILNKCRELTHALVEDLNEEGILVRFRKHNKVSQ